jgi:lipopolysaccharide transport system ATP-binding protein
MSAPAIRVQGVGKQFRLGAARTSFPTLRDALAASTRRAGAMMFSPLRSFRERPRPETFWALRDVSFDVQPGEVVGIIGGNGAGKSTLLKILSRITEPTEGRVEIRGRVGSLLEVGTGFHPELSGRENTFLNGAILGMHRHEIARKFDEIVAFAEVERFIDMPVKHYSSGMYLRLAFAVAAHLEPEILIVDEVLAVGDAAFQKKCLGKMGDVARHGRTVLFVSHNMAAVRALCSKAVMLESGRVTVAGPVESCISHYAAARHHSLQPTWQRPPGESAGALTIESIAVELLGSRPDHQLMVDLALVSRAQHKPAFLAVDIRDLGGTPVMQALPVLAGFLTPESARHPVRIGIELNGLIPGQYTVSVWAGSHNDETLDFAEEAVSFEVLDSPTPGRSFPHTPDHGFIVPKSYLARPPA